MSDSSLRAVELRCEHEVNPLGMGEPHPRFSWVLDSDLWDVVQQSYHIQVSADPEFRRVLWDTGKVNRKIRSSWNTQDQRCSHA